MRVAVVTPYYLEPLEQLFLCHQSVLGQTISCDHVLVADGYPRREVSDWKAFHIILPRSHHDIGSTARLIGSVHAMGSDYDYIAFLDADNWLEPTHICDLATSCDQTGSVIASSSRMLCRIDGSPMAICPITNPDKFIDTSCMFFGRAAFYLIQKWVLMPKYGHLIGDRIFWHYVRKASLPMTHTGRPTVFYRCQKEGLYRLLGEPVPNGVQKRPNYELSHLQWLKDGNPPLF